MPGPKRRNVPFSTKKTTFWHQFEPPREESDDEHRKRRRPISQIGLVGSDFVVSFIWVCSGSVLRYLACKVLGSGMSPIALAIKGSLAVIYLYCFSWFGKATNGGSYNPLMVLCYAIFGDFRGFLFVVFGRIPAQVIGSIIGVWLINATFPAAAHGPSLNVDMHNGALTEGLLTFVLVIASLWLKKVVKSSSMRTWISSILKVICHIISSDMTGGILNPAAAFGWAYVQGEHLTKEHLSVYWLAPMEATLAGVWICSLFFEPQKHRRQHRKQIKFKSE
ncbi:aquaporin SIP2-1-like [Typha latifolia]|uniref:aquaporin SIP2-1-like n=1 Tax=Typha latifolia TaxID=4733 RepID=UPI003C2C4A45